MGFAEQKVELLKIIAEADEEKTGKLIEFAYQLENKSHTFSEEEIAMFEKRADDFFASGDKGYTAEESLALLRERIK